MEQQQLNNATTTTQQMQCNYACGSNRATAPFSNVVIWLDRLKPPSLKKQQSYNSLRLKINRATAPFAKQMFMQ